MHTPKSKISVKHYLNTKLKKGSQGYPVYVQITYKRKTNLIRSLLDFECEIEEFENLKRNRQLDFEIEKDFITNEIEYADRYTDDFILKKNSLSNEPLYFLVERLLEVHLFAAILFNERKGNSQESIYSYDDILDEAKSFLSQRYLNYEKYIKEGSLVPIINWKTGGAFFILNVLSSHYKSYHNFQWLKRAFTDNELHNIIIFPDELGTSVSVGSWLIGFTPYRIQRLFEGRGKEEQALDLIESIDYLLKHAGFEKSRMFV